MTKKKENQPPAKDVFQISHELGKSDRQILAEIALSPLIANTCTLPPSIRPAHLSGSKSSRGKLVVRAGGLKIEVGLQCPDPP